MVMNVPPKVSRRAKALTKAQRARGRRGPEAVIHMHTTANTWARPTHTTHVSYVSVGIDTAVGTHFSRNRKYTTPANTRVGGDGGGIGRREGRNTSSVTQVAGKAAGTKGRRKLDRSR